MAIKAVEDYMMKNHAKIINPESKRINLDGEILRQINLSHHQCKVLCVEWNGILLNDTFFTNYANSFGLYEINRNGENIIFAKKI